MGLLRGSLSDAQPPSISSGLRIAMSWHFEMKNEPSEISSPALEFGALVFDVVASESMLLVAIKESSTAEQSHSPSFS